MSPKPLRIDDLPEGAVVALAARPGDAVLGCGGALAQHALRGDAVRLVVLGGGLGEEAAAREAEVRAAARALGIEDVVWEGAPPDDLADDHDLAARVAALCTDAVVVYAPDPLRADLPTRAVAAAAGAPVRRADVRLALYGLPGTEPAQGLFDVSPVRPEKDAALSRLGVGDRATMDGARAGGAGLEGVERAEAIQLLPHGTDALMRLMVSQAGQGIGRATAVLSTWNKREDVLANLEALQAQTRPFMDIVVVDNASGDGTADAIRERYPRVRVVVMPHSAYGACETFNIGFASARTELIAILDDDVVLPPAWLERAIERLQREPESTAIVSTKVVEPEMPEAYLASEAINSERYMSTFRGCASLARKAAIEECGYYDERLFIYGNERDLTCRLLNRGYRVLQFPGTHAFHKTPFGIQMGKRSLYYHARNAWLAQLKYAPLRDLLRLPFLVVSRVLLRARSAEESGEVWDATGTIGIGRALRETKGAWWVLVKAGCSVLWNLPYCLRRREPCTAQDYQLPID